MFSFSQTVTCFRRWTVGKKKLRVKFDLCVFSSDSSSKRDSDPGNHSNPCSGADDPSRYGDGPGRPAEDHPASVDCRRLTTDPDPSSPQPRPAGCTNLCHRVPSAAALSTPAVHQGSSSPGWHQGENSCQAQRGEQLSVALHRCD